MHEGDTTTEVVLLLTGECEALKRVLPPERTCGLSADHAKDVTRVSVIAAPQIVAINSVRAKHGARRAASFV